MSELDEKNVASHTLHYLRRLDRRQDEFVDLLTRQTELIGRLHRDVREGFDLIGQRLDHVERDLRDIKSDVLLLENKLLNRMSAEMNLSRRLTRIEERLSVEPDDELPQSTL